VEARCRLVREEMESQKLALRAKFSVEKLKLPKAIRQMPLKQFLEEYGEDVQAVLHTAIQSTAASAGPADDDVGAGEPRTVVKGSRGQRAGVAQTPGAAAGGSSCSTRAGFATRYAYNSLYHSVLYTSTCTAALSKMVLCTRHEVTRTAVCEGTVAA
jgi:Nbl1 / Borealin N terminal